MKKITIRIAVIAVVCLGLLAIGLTLSLGSIIKKGVETVGPQLTKTEMKLDRATLSVFSGAGTLQGLLLGNPEGYQTPSAVKVGQVSVGVIPRSVFSDKVHVTHVNVQAPEITFEGSLGTKNNLSRILENVESATGGDSKATDKSKTPPAAKGASRKLQVDDFLISGAKVNVSMAMLGGKSLTLPLPEIHFTGLGTGPEGITAAELTQKVLREVTAATIKVVEKGVTDLGQGATEAVKSLSKGATNTLDKATKSLGDLFKKK